MATKQIVLNGRTYILSTLLHSEAREVFFVLLRNVGPGLGELISSLSGGFSGLADLDTKALGRALQDVALRLNAADAAQVSEAFGKVTTVVANGKKVELTVKVQETHFSGAMGEWFQWIAACVQLNYADFLGLLTRAGSSPRVEAGQSPDESDPDAE